MPLDPSPLSLAQTIDALFAHPRPLPRDAVAEQVVLWRTFRNTDQAREFAKSIQLGAGQTIIGGRTYDSVGDLYWLGVHVDDLSKWGNTRSIQRSGRFDPEDPTTQGRPFG